LYKRTSSTIISKVWVQLEEDDMNNNLHKKKTAYCQPAGSFPAPMVQENRLCLMNGKKIALVDGYAVGE
jgi:hypothetical protein